MNDDANFWHQVKREVDRDHVIANITDGLSDKLPAFQLDAFFGFNAVGDSLSRNGAVQFASFTSFDWEVELQLGKNIGDAFQLNVERSAAFSGFLCDRFCDLG